MTAGFRRLPRSFFEGPDVVQIARALVGKYVFTQLDGSLTGGRIVETEAYNGRTDKACHAFLKRTRRTEIMYEQGGLAYVYLCYGIHEMFNIVTNKQGLADAILIRALEPVVGHETMAFRRGGDKGFKLTAGPGNVTKALGINRTHLGTSLSDSQEIWLAEGVDDLPSVDIAVDRRVGVDYAEEDALLPWRFFAKGSKWISKPMQKDASSRFDIQRPGTMDSGAEK
ncbi:MAG: DNA-3-methyladenine glycosylase [Bacteroidota bacterium]